LRPKTETPAIDHQHEAGPVEVASSARILEWSIRDKEKAHARNFHLELRERGRDQRGARDGRPLPVKQEQRVYKL
jgi:hypothetical protein